MTCHSVVHVHDNVKAVKLYSKVDGGTLYVLPPFLSPPFPFLPPLPIIPLEDWSGPLNPGRSVDSDVARVWKWVHENRTYRRHFHERHTHDFGEESWSPPFPQKKLNLGLAEVQFLAVLTGLLAFFSLFLVDILSRSQFSSTPLHRISMQISKNCETHIFKKWSNVDRPPVAPPVVWCDWSPSPHPGIITDGNIRWADVICRTGESEVDAKSKVYRYVGFAPSWSVAIREKLWCYRCATGPPVCWLWRSG